MTGALTPFIPLVRVDEIQPSAYYIAITDALNRTALTDAATQRGVSFEFNSAETGSNFAISILKTGDRRVLIESAPSDVLAAILCRTDTLREAIVNFALGDGALTGL